MSSERPVVGDRVRAAEDTVTAAFRAFESQDWNALVELTDAGSIEALRTRYVQMRRHMPPFPKFDMQELREMYKPEFMDDAEDKYRVLFDRREFGELAGVFSLADAEALDSAEFLKRWAQARHPEYLFDGKTPWYHQIKLEKHVVVGSIATLPDTVAVVVRRADVPIDVHAHEFIAVLGDNRGGWTLDAESQWLGMADLLF